MSAINNEVVEFSASELAMLEQLGMRKRVKPAKAVRSSEELALIEKAKAAGYVGKGGGDGSKPRLNKGVGALVRKLLAEQPSAKDRDILDQVCKFYNNDNTTLACIAWYRNDEKKKALEVK